MLRIFLLAFLVGATFSPAVGQTTGNQSTNNETAPRQAWTVSCEVANDTNTFQCVMNQTVVLKKTGQRLISGSLTKKSGDQKTNLRIGLPHGIFLPDGVEIRVDEGKSRKIAIQTADQNGSYASAELSLAEIDNLKRGSFLHITVNSSEGQPITFQLSLVGFTVAFSKL